MLDAKPNKSYNNKYHIIKSIESCFVFMLLLNNCKYKENLCEYNLQVLMLPNVFLHMI